MNDNNIRGEQWKPLIAEYFVKNYGGEYEKWMEANYHATLRIMDQLNVWTQENTKVSHKKFKDFENKTQVESMFSYMGKKLPSKENYVKINYNLEKSIPPQINSAFPGITTAIKSLKTLGYTLYTSSGETSLVLNGYLTAMGLNDCFKILYGPDLVGVMKTGKEFFEAILNHSSVNPKKTIIIDDKPELLKQLTDLGVYTVQACLTNDYDPEIDRYFTNANDLVNVISSITE